MRHVHLLFVFMLLLVAGIPAAFAQKRTISGKISETTGKGIPFVNVTVKGTTLGTTSDADGRFSVDVPDGSKTLIFSISGYKTQEVNLTNSPTLDLMLSQDVAELETVVVTALGIERKAKSLQYSVTTVGGENFTQARELSIVNALEGRVAGVDVSKIASGPSASTRVIIRGTKTLGSTLNQPLYVVDGIPIDNSYGGDGGQSGRWGGTDKGDGMSSINPDDVASISVLKGASASALYGSRAANGVILITTKKGSARKGVGIEFNSNYVIEEVNNLTDFQKSYGSGGMEGSTLQTQVATKATSVAEAFGNDWNQQAWGPKFDGSPVVQFDGVTRPYSYVGDNWERFFETGNTFTNSLALTAGNENSNMRLSVADLRNDGIIPNSGYDRINVGLSGASKFGKKLSLNVKVLYSNEKTKNRPMVSDSPDNAVQSLYRLPGDVNVLDLKGDPDKLGAVPSLEMQAAQGITIYDQKKPGEEFQRSTDLWTQNPYWAAYQKVNTDVRDRVIPSALIRYDFTDFLYATGQFGMDWQTQRGSVLTPEGTGHNRSGSRQEFERRIRETNYQWTVGFNKVFDKIGVNAFVGGNRMRRNNEFLQLEGSGFSVFGVPAISNAKAETFGYGLGESGINSIFGSAEVSYNNYLFLTATARTDWFSVLDPEDNSITYPSVGASFVFTDAFSLPAWLTYGKARISWAQVGNVSSVNPYSINLAYAPFSTHVGVPFGGYSTGQNNSSTFPNPKLKPFTSSEFEFGVEARFFENRLGIDFTYYDQQTTDDILNASISRASGFTGTTVNLGKISNNGIEVLLTGTPVKSSITWDVSLNFAKNNSNVDELVPGQTEVTDADPNVAEPRTRNVLIKNIVDQPYGMITGLVQSRDPSGNLVFNEDGSIVSDGKYYVIGQGVPDFTGGLLNTVTWKQLNLGFLIDFKSGGDIFSGTNMRMTQQGFHKQSLLGRAGEAPLVLTGVTPDAATGGFKPFNKTLTPGEARNYWDKLGQESSAATEHFLYDASFIKLRQVTLGYTLPGKLFKNSPVQSLMVSLVGRNLAIIHKDVPNIDPESNYNNTNNQGFDYFGMPATRTYGFNIRVIF